MTKSVPCDIGPQHCWDRPNWLVDSDAVARLPQPHLDLEELKNVLSLLQDLAPPFTPLTPGSPLTWSQLMPPQR